MSSRNLTYSNEMYKKIKEKLGDDLNAAVLDAADEALTDHPARRYIFPAELYGYMVDGMCNIQRNAQSFLSLKSIIPKRKISYILSHNGYVVHPGFSSINNVAFIRAEEYCPDFTIESSSIPEAV